MVWVGSALKTRQRQHLLQQMLSGALNPQFQSAAGLLIWVGFWLFARLLTSRPSAVMGVRNSCAALAIKRLCACMLLSSCASRY